jgi:hypothetical protein
LTSDIRISASRRDQALRWLRMTELAASCGLTT